MIRVANRPYKLKICSSTITWQGGTDANAPSSPERLSCEIGTLAVWFPFVWMFGHVLQIFKNKSEEAFKNSRKNESVSNKMGLEIMQEEQQIIMLKCSKLLWACAWACIL